MIKEMISLIKSAYTNEEKFVALENIYYLYDQLQYSENLNEMATDLATWLKTKYNVDNLHFYLFDMDHDTSTTILKQGEEFSLSSELSFYFIINTHTSLNAIVSFEANDTQHYETINNDREFIEAAFFQISPILQNGIIKKNNIESSSIDSVTNVYSRKYLVQKIDKIISLSNNESNNITFLMIGIDHFKAVIDEFDYDMGDKVLVELAKVIYANITNFDIVSRLTGDEFLVALVNLSYPEEAVGIAQKIIDEFAQTQIVVDMEKNLILKKTICIGLSTYPQDGETITHVLKNADSFLYEAKNKGRGELAVYTEEDLSSIDLF